MNWFQELLSNPFLLIGLSSWFWAQLIKTIIHAIVTKSIDFTRLIGDGGMPSGHSATVSAFNSLASEKLPEAKLKEFVGHTPLQVIAGILLGVANTFIMYYCVL